MIGSMIFILISFPERFWEPWTRDFPDGTLELTYPWVVLLLPLPLLIWWLLPSYKEEQSAVRFPFFEQLAGIIDSKPSPSAVVLRRNWLQWVVAPAIWILVLAAASRPQWIEPPLEKIESGRDLLLAVDLSGSMEVADFVDPQGKRISRLDAVKFVLDDFITRRAGDRLGLLVFGNAAHVQAPFTQDHDTVRQLLDMMEVAMAGPQTMIGDAIGLAIKMFDESYAEHRTMILLTDGNDTGSRIPPAKAAEIAGQRGVTIHTVAMGDPNATGSDVVDVNELRDISSRSGGHFFLGSNRDQLEGIYRQLDEIEKIEFESLNYRPKHGLFQYPLGAAVLLLLVFYLIMVASGMVSRWRVRDV